MPKPSIPSRPKTTEGQTAVTRASASANIETDKDSPIQPDAPPDKTYAMFKEMSESVLRCINERFDAFETKFNALAASQSELQARVASQEQAVTELDARMVTLEARHSELAKCNTQLHAKCRIWKPALGDITSRSWGYKRVKKRPAAGAKPRTILARIHHFQDKDLILRLGRQQPLDEVMAQRRAFRDVMQALRDGGVKHTLRYPAKLFVYSRDGEAPMISRTRTRQRGSWKGTT
ncbi:unnamed protein product [Pleuronectes platessa]|uniref:Uncharacterized protein n=1 Tax=Pleuronectes platessa TaxID=8262 RepID=A0A9N7V1X7_PLEPL|nr:unnamed protein product [Pleuronectes platessa]